MALRHANWLAIPVALLSVVGCKNESGTGTTTTASAPAAQAPQAPTTPATASAERTARGRHAGMRHAGIAGMLLNAAEELPLKPEQKTKIEQIVNELHQRSPAEPGAMQGTHRDRTKSGTMPAADRDQAKGGTMPATDPEQAKAMPGGHVGAMHGDSALNAALVAGVKAGSIDRAKLEPQLTALEEAEKARREKSAKALNELHATLDATQRKAAAETVRAKLAKRSERMGAHKTESKDQVKDMGGDRSKRRLEHLTQKLDLDAAQQKKVEPLLAKTAPVMKDADKDAMKKRNDAVLSDFEKDRFDATKLELGGMNARKGMERMIQYLNGLLPILKPEQREKLATEMEQHRGFGRGERGDRYQGMTLDRDLQLFIGEDEEEEDEP